MSCGETIRVAGLETQSEYRARRGCVASPTHLFPSRAARLHAVAALDDIGLQADGTWSAMEL